MSEVRGDGKKYVRRTRACRSGESFGRASSVAAEPRAGNASRHTRHLPEETV